MAEAEALQRQLLEAQNQDGGWPYQHGSSWTEPTAFALLALEAQHSQESHAFERGSLWLQNNQRSDGGWPPNRSVQISTWVTSLALLALSDTGLTADQRRRAVQWLTSQVEPEIHPLQRLVLRVREIAPPVQIGGSPWFPGTAAWIAPTVLTVLALSGAARSQSDPNLRSYVREAQQFILCRRCRDGGWNHGGSRYLSEDTVSYPEMTGMALLALYGAPPSQLDLSLKLAEAHLQSVASMEALCWLELGLARHGRQPDRRQSGPASRPLPCHTTRDISLRLLALSTDSSTNKLLTALS